MEIYLLFLWEIYLLFIKHINIGKPMILFIIDPFYPIPILIFWLEKTFNPITKLLFSISSGNINSFVDN